jgi:hypothetical protein
MLVRLFCGYPWISMDRPHRCGCGCGYHFNIHNRKFAVVGSSLVTITAGMPQSSTYTELPRLHGLPPSPTKYNSTGDNGSIRPTSQPRITSPPMLIARGASRYSIADESMTSILVYSPLGNSTISLNFTFSGSYTVTGTPSF